MSNYDLEKIYEMSSDELKSLTKELFYGEEDIFIDAFIRLLIISDLKNTGVKTFEEVDYEKIESVSEVIEFDEYIKKVLRMKKIYDPKKYKLVDEKTKEESVDENEYLGDKIDSLLIRKVKNNVKVPISTFICNTFGIDECTRTGLRISNALIRVAATRIFSEPEQSIIELVTNSIDSYNSIDKIDSIGKFGMGFFSLLYWISQAKDDEYKRSMIIESTYYDDSKKLTSYSIKLKWTEDGIIFTKLPTDQQSKPRTQVLILCNGHEFKVFERQKMKNQVQKLFDVKSATILFNGNPINEGANKNNVINVDIESGYISVRDYATGIKEETVFNSLLIPSSSSKERKMIKDVTKRSPRIAKNMDITSYLRIIVNSVSVVNIKSSLSSDSYILYLPNDSKLPVSRDDIIYEDYESEKLYDQLCTLIVQIFEDSKDLYPLFDLLEKYIIVNKQEKLFSVITKLKREILDMDYILIPKNDFWKTFVKTFDPPNYCFYPYSDKFKLCKQLDEILSPYVRTDIFKSRKCIHMNLPNGKITESSELPLFLFINGNFNNPEELAISITTSSNTLLIPVNSKLEEKQYNRIRSSDKEYNDMCETLFMTIYKKFQGVEFYSQNSMFVDMILNIDKYLHNDNVLPADHPLKRANIMVELKRLVCNLISKIASINLEFTYGASKHVMEYNLFDMLGFSDNEKIHYGKFSNNFFVRNYYFDLQIQFKNDLFLIQQLGYVNISPLTSKFSNHKSEKEQMYNFTKINVKLITRLSYILKHEYARIKKENLVELVHVLVTNKRNPEDINDDYIESIAMLNWTYQQKFDDCSNWYTLINYVNFKLYNYVIDLYKPDAKGYYALPIIENFLDVDYFMIMNQSNFEEFESVVYDCSTNEELFTFITVAKIFIIEQYYYLLTYPSPGVYKFILTEIRRKYTNLVLHDIIKDVIWYIYSSTDTMKLTFQEDLVKSTVAFFKNLIYDRYFDIKEPEYMYQFTCKSLLSYIYINDLTDDGDSDKDRLQNLFESVAGFDEETTTKLQIVEIAVNEGTTKMFSQAILTELVQNSTDAIRTSQNQTDEMFNVYVKTANNAISVADRVGFSDLDDIVSLLIPFLSSKDPNDPNVTGEMGTGFFNVYRQPYVKEVHIKIKHNDCYLYVKCTPLIRDNSVYDIQYEIYISENEESNGTEIIIILRDDMPDLINDVNVFMNSRIGYSVFNNMTEGQKILSQNIDKIRKTPDLFEKSNLLDFCYQNEVPCDESETFSELVEKLLDYYDSIQKPKQIIYHLNDKPLSRDLTLIMEYPGIGEMYYSRDKIGSFVMTNGVPFCSLVDFVETYPEIFNGFETMMKTSIILNLSKDNYIPTQSRTNINIKNKRNLVELLNTGFYFVSLYKYVHNLCETRDNIIPFSTSIANAAYVKVYDCGVMGVGYNSYSDQNFKIFNSYDLSNLVISYIPINKKIRLSSLINELASDYSDETRMDWFKIYLTSMGMDQEDTTKILDGMHESDETFSHYVYIQNKFKIDIALVLFALDIWFGNKQVNKIKEETVFVKDKNGTTLSSSVDIKKEWTLLSDFVQLYWYHLFDAIEDGIVKLPNELNKTCPKVLSGNSSNGHLGFYSQNEHCIVMNVKHYDPDNFKESILKIRGMSEEDAALFIQTDSEMIKYFISNISTTLIHELGHAVQGSTHDSPHGLTNIRIRNGDMLEFDAMCVGIYKVLLERGLLTNYISNIMDMDETKIPDI